MAIILRYRTKKDGKEITLCFNRATFATDLRYNDGSRVDYKDLWMPKLSRVGGNDQLKAHNDFSTAAISTCPLADLRDCSGTVWHRLPASSDGVDYGQK